MSTATHGIPSGHESNQFTILRRRRKEQGQVSVHIERAEVVQKIQPSVAIKIARPQQFGPIVIRKPEKLGKRYQELRVLFATRTLNQSQLPSPGPIRPASADR